MNELSISLFILMCLKLAICLWGVLFLRRVLYGIQCLFICMNVDMAQDSIVFNSVQESNENRHIIMHLFGQWQVKTGHMMIKIG